MDFQSQIAARRAELERTARQAQVAAVAETQAQQAVERAEREKALSAIATDLTRRGVNVTRQGEELAFSQSSRPQLDLAGLRKSKVQGLVNREARRMWSPGENWQVIGLIVSGLFLTTFYGLGLVLILLGVMRRSALNKRYRALLNQRHPALRH